ncbi:hypothetical protein C0Z01_03175 [Photobacterium kishitanii]|uniref:Uncharacterized protein n=1 Tax=Photobacterium kishitanii TaxID=318456 RepID=A0A0B7JJ86_9GAMM|nr:hypothetical protein [Photobacterium kishitanii]OBU23770.1 hypothetical protein AYY22_05335 [Photobacterium kishitanii]PSU91746.1 hypothetical protein C0W42_03550 [Photobacterium kishitanii]PSU92979.1 hypothetical protein C0W35_13200 [Photobacterium kishitanii]PSU95889.1 hypothetical protein C9J27_17300 [Photobacterium kishitanii]PSV22240.1 hypothetical protein C0W28_06385 [Photobacterium kishitanii]
MRFSQKVGLTLGASLLILTILLIIVAGRTYKTEAVVGRVVNVNSNTFQNEGKFHLQVMSDQTNSMINIDIQDGLYCPVGSQVVFVQKSCMLFGDDAYEFISCDFSYLPPH